MIDRIGIRTAMKYSVNSELALNLMWGSGMIARKETRLGTGKDSGIVV